MYRQLGNATLGKKVRHMEEKRKNRQRIFCICFSVLLAGYTLYALLDTFVIPHRYVFAGQEGSVSAGSPATQRSTEELTGDEKETRQKKSFRRGSVSFNGEKTGGKPGGKPEGKPGGKTEKRTDNDTGDEGGTDSAVENSTVTEQYKDGNVEINIIKYRYLDSDIYVADVKASSPDVLKTAFAENTYGRNIKAATSDIAEENNAVLAINGDFYGSRESGYVIRNGVLYRDRGSEGTQALAIMEDGSFKIFDEGSLTAEDLLEEGAVQVLSFGPGLINDGEITVTEEQEVGKAMASNPRTAIGILDDLHYVFVVSDGRTDESEGLSLYELAGFMEDIGCKCAYNLDGGGSSTMYFNGEIINNPTTTGRSEGERSVSDIVYIDQKK